MLVFFDFSRPIDTTVPIGTDAVMQVLNMCLWDAQYQRMRLCLPTITDTMMLKRLRTCDGEGILERHPIRRMLSSTGEPEGRVFTAPDGNLRYQGPNEGTIADLGPQYLRLWELTGFLVELQHDASKEAKQIHAAIIHKIAAAGKIHPLVRPTGSDGVSLPAFASVIHIPHTPWFMLTRFYGRKGLGINWDGTAYFVPASVVALEYQLGKTRPK